MSFTANDSSRWARLSCHFTLLTERRDFSRPPPVVQRKKSALKVDPAELGHCPCAQHSLQRSTPHKEEKSTGNNVTMDTNTMALIPYDNNDNETMHSNLTETNKFIKLSNTKTGQMEGHSLWHQDINVEDIVEFIDYQEHSQVIQEQSKVLQEQSEVLQEQSKVIQEQSKVVQKQSHALQVQSQTPQECYNTGSFAQYSRYHQQVHLRPLPLHMTMQLPFQVATNHKYRSMLYKPQQPILARVPFLRAAHRASAAKKTLLPNPCNKRVLLPTPRVRAPGL